MHVLPCLEVGRGRAWARRRFLPRPRPRLDIACSHTLGDSNSGQSGGILPCIRVLTIVVGGKSRLDRGRFVVC
jgi:hypothetical protein